MTHQSAITQWAKLAYGRSTQLKIAVEAVNSYIPHRALLLPERERLAILAAIHPFQAEIIDALSSTIMI